ncbi:MAG: histidine kinase [Anaeromyxobacter sp. RBG_16_69_14]|nr:MAG: histidine kinase [Anaeromyxobacter sp. RBG_16_69_14]
MSETLRVMVVDDEPIVGRRLRPVLEKLGFEVEVFEDPVLALARFAEGRFEIVVSDIRMRGMDGIALLERVRAHAPRAKVILITGHPSPEVAAEAMAKGAFEYIAKPFKTDALRRVVERAALSLGEMPPPSSSGSSEE